MHRRPARHPVTLIATASCLALVVSGCSGESSSGDAASTTAVVDGVGAKVELPSNAKRVVCLTGVCDDALVELGLKPAASTGAGPSGLLAEPTFLGPRAARAVPMVQGAFGEENVEQVVQAEPDLVVGLAGAHDKLRSAVGKAAPLYLAKVGSYHQSEDFLRMMGRVTGRQKQATQAINRFRSKLTTAQRSVGGRTVTSLAMFGSDTDFSVDSTGSVLGSVLGRLGRYPWKPSSAQRGGHSDGVGSYSLEQIKQRDPDVIFVQTLSFGPKKSTPVSTQLSANPVWKRIRAVRNGDVVEVPTTIWSAGRGTRSLGIVATSAAGAMKKAAVRS